MEEEGRGRWRGKDVKVHEEEGRGIRRVMRGWVWLVEGEVENLIEQAADRRQQSGKEGGRD